MKPTNTQILLLKRFKKQAIFSSIVFSLFSLLVASAVFQSQLIKIGNDFGAYASAHHFPKFISSINGEVLAADVFMGIVLGLFACMFYGMTLALNVQDPITADALREQLSKLKSLKSNAKERIVSIQLSIEKLDGLNISNTEEKDSLEKTRKNIGSLETEITSMETLLAEVEACEVNTLTKYIFGKKVGGCIEGSWLLQKV